MRYRGGGSAETREEHHKGVDETFVGDFGEGSENLRYKLTGDQHLPLHQLQGLRRSFGVAKPWPRWTCCALCVGKPCER